MAAGGDATDVKVGPGRLWVAAIGTTEPTSASAVLPSAWRAIGYTEEGSTFSQEVTTEPIEVAEELDPIRYVNTRRAGSLAFSMAEMNRKNLALAMNSGITTDSTVAYEPPDLGTEVRIMIVWDSNETATDLVTNGGNVRWLFRQAYQTAAMETAFQKAPAKSLLPVTFQLEKPSGFAPWKVFPNAAFQVA